MQDSEILRLCHWTKKWPWMSWMNERLAWEHSIHNYNTTGYWSRQVLPDVQTLPFDHQFREGPSNQLRLWNHVSRPSPSSRVLHLPHHDPDLRDVLSIREDHVHLTPPGSLCHQGSPQDQFFPEVPRVPGDLDTRGFLQRKKRLKMTDNPFPRNIILKIIINISWNNEFIRNSRCPTVTLRSS